MSASDEDDAEEPSLEILTVELPPELVGQRLDKALAAAIPDLSRARIQALIASGRVSLEGAPLTSASAKAAAGTYEVEAPPPEPADVEPQDIPLKVLFEDAHLIVIDKPAGMAVHPAPGSPDRTLVNALLHHCQGGLSGIGGVARPGIVHRLDKDTSGVMVAAKSDAAHAGLAAQFARHDIERMYLALVRGGRIAVTDYATERLFGSSDKPLAARLACRLQTGRTHQIRVHLASKGSPCLGDPLYGSGPPAPAVRAAIAEAGLARQALHAAVLGFRHPVTGEAMRFETAPPEDMAALQAALERL